jgi:site-specific recombinase XerD
MATLLKNGAYYALQFYDRTRSPARKKVSLRISRKPDALKVKRLLETRLAEGLIDPWTQHLSAPHWGIDSTPRIIPRTLAEATEAFLHSRANCRQSTRDHYRWVLGGVLTALGGSLPVQCVGHLEIQRWLETVSSNTHTRHTYLRTFGIACRWMVSHGILLTDPTQGFVLPRPPDKLSSKLITEDQLQVIVETALESSTPYIGDLAIVVFDHALRLSEACAMKCFWFNPESRLLTITQDSGFSTKTGKDVVKPVSERAEEILARLSGGRGAADSVFLNNCGRPLTPKHTSKRFKAIVRRAGLPESITFHGLRHGGISKALANGASVEAVRMFAGHTTVAMTMRYAHLLSDQYEEQIRIAMDSRPARKEVSESLWRYLEGKRGQS